MNKTGLVLEGGGMRGVYTAGVLEFFLDHDLFFPYVVGVSAGACIASSYLSRQKGRNKKVNVDYAAHPEYISFKNLIRRRELFGMDFLFDTLPNRLVPFDFQTLRNAEERFVVGTTDCMTGHPVYYEKDAYDDKGLLTVLRASSSLPFMAPIVHLGKRALLDGGISDPIPIKKSEEEGNSKNVLILTRTRGYVKQIPRLNWFLKRTYPQYPGLIQAMERRHQVYNETMKHIEKQEKAGNAFVIRPLENPRVRRVERNPRKLLGLYQRGYEHARSIYPDLMEWLKR